MAENVLLPEDLAIPCKPYDEPFSRWKPQICGASAPGLADPSLVAGTGKDALPQGSFVHDESLTVPRPPLVRMTVRRRGRRFVPRCVAKPSWMRPGRGDFRVDPNPCLIEGYPS